jgi:Flp pilus assembly pilin Flp
MLSFLFDLHSRTVAALRREEGQGLTEYALILVFVAIVAIVALQLLGANVTKVINQVATTV